ncbi:lantibiotic dehydratase [Actinophytocola sediminis]
MVDAALLRAVAYTPSWIAAAWPDVPADTEEHLAQWRDWLDHVMADDQIMAAIEMASPVLAERTRRVFDGRPTSTRDLRRLVLSLARYLVRGTGRPTPFGLFAGVAPVHFGPATIAYSGKRHKAIARVDAEWLARVVARLEASVELRRHLAVVVNDLAFTRDGRLVMGCERHASASSETAAAEISVKLTKAVDIVVQAARTPTAVGALADALAAEFPATRDSVIDGMVAELVARRILVTNLRPLMTAADPLGQVIEQATARGADAFPDDAALLGQLRDLQRDLAAHNQSTSHTRQRVLRTQVSAAMDDIAPTDKPLAVDLRLDHRVVLPDQVAREAQAAADILARLAVHPAGNPAWRDYHSRFLERYGMGAMVAVADLVNADTGLGFPAGYRDSRLTPPAAPSLSERDVALLAMAQKAALDHSIEVVLDDDAIGRLAVDDVTTVQPHTELRFRIQAPTRAALDRGEFELTVAGVSRAAGTTTGRFLDVLDLDDRERMITAYQGLSTLHDDALAAQLSGPALALRAENVARSQQVLPTLVSFAEHRAPDEGTVTLDDLAVTADADHLYLVSLSRRRLVEPTVFSAVEFTHAAHPLLRFLCEITTARATVCAPFTWGAASWLPYLPRIRYRRTVLSPARWTVDATDLPGQSASSATWTEQLAARRRRYRLPDSVYVGEDDRRLHLNLNRPAHLHLLRVELDRAGTVQLREAPGDDAFGWIDGRAHEIVVPLAADQPAPPRRRRHPWSAHTVKPALGHLPGSDEWLYLKLYGHPDRHDAILTGHLPRLVRTGYGPLRWWFLRYQDPEPHLRLRFRLTDTTDSVETARQVATWTAGLRERGLIGHAQLDTYYPEVGRFGPGPAMTAAETVFAADSEAVLTQLASLAGTGAPYRQALIAASMVDLAVAATGDSGAGLRWLLDHVDRTAAEAPARRVHDQAITLADPDNQRSALRAIPGGEAIADAWGHRSTALATYRDRLAATTNITTLDVLPDLTHLHFVRMTGLDPHGERSCARLARAAALSWTSRTRGAR